MPLRVGEEADESVKQLQRFICRAERIPRLPDKVEERSIAFNPALELFCLKPEELNEMFPNNFPRE